MPETGPAGDAFAQLGWADLEAWAGRRIVQRGKRYRQEGCVADIGRTAAGGLVAWVSGSRRYATNVTIEEGEIASGCTCPYGPNCKHAVAVVLEYLDRLKHDRPVPAVPPQDERLEVLQSDRADEAIDPTADEEQGLAGGAGVAHESFKRLMAEKTKSELVRLVSALVVRHPALHEDILDRERLKKGNVRPIIKRLRYLIREVGSEDGWQNYRWHEGHTPDYSEVKEKLQQLLEAGHADEVLSLGQELMASGREQVARSHDDGETAMEISACIPVVAKALHRSSMPAADKLIWAIDALLKDEYDLFHSLASYLDRPHPKAEWSAVADRLQARFSKFQGSDYDRNRSSDWVIRALKGAGRDEEAIALCEQEAPITSSYCRLVKALIAAKRTQEAEQWIHQGIKATEKSLPGIAAELRHQLLEVRRRLRDTAGVAALSVDEFVRSPGEGTYAACRRAAAKMKIWEQVREALLDFLETGRLPWKRPHWPLPPTGTETTERFERAHFPKYDALMAIAMHEKQPDQVIHWFDRKPRGRLSRYGSMEERVADAVRGSHPDRSAAIWKSLAEQWISQVQPSAYREAAVYLKKLKQLLNETGQPQEWTQYVATIRIEHARKRSLLEVLDALEGTPILKGGHEKRK